MPLTLARPGLAAVAVAAVLTIVGRPAPGQLVAFYEFDGNTNDSSGNGLHATNTGMLFGQGQMGGSIANDGTAGRFVSVPLNVGSDVTDKLTWGGWVQLNSLSYQSIAWMEGNWGRNLRIDDRRVGGAASGTFSYAAMAGRGEHNPWPESTTTRPLRAILPGTAAVADANYRFVATSYDAANKRTVLYVDDQMYEMGNSTPFVPWAQTTFQIGATNGAENINGAIDNFFVFSGVLSPQQVATIRTAANPRTAAIAVGQQFSNRTWKIDLQDTLGAATLGIDNVAGNGIDEWNVFQVGDYGVAVNNPSLSNLITTTGAATNASFHFVDTVATRLAEYSDLRVQGTVPTTVQPWRWSTVAGLPVGRDGVIFNNGTASGTSPVADYELRGLVPGRLYNVAINGTQATGSGLNWADNNQPSAFDTDGDGVIDQMMRFNSEAGTFNEFTVKADANGTIRGRTFGTNRSRNTTYGYWIGLAGLQVEELPEPANPAAGTFVAGGKAFADKPNNAYNFEVHDTAGNGGTLFDRVGGQHGVVRTGTNGVGAILQNGVLDLAGGGAYETAGYGDLPNYILPDEEVTIESWVAMRDVTSGHWRRVFTFGDDAFGGTGDGEVGEVTDQFSGHSALSAFEYRMQRVRTDSGNRAPAHEVAMLNSATNPLVVETGNETGTLMRITDDPWQEDVMVHSVVTVRDNGRGGSLMSVYHNGSIVYEATMSSNLSVINDVNNWLGRNSDNGTGLEQHANGRYDEFRIWDRALTQAEIRSNFWYGPDWSGIAGDATGDWRIDATDIDRVNAARRGGETGPRFDVNRDGGVTQADLTTLVETVLETRTGDANLDGRVLASDFSLALANWQGSQKGWGQGDFNADGTVQANDLSLLLGNFGYTRPGVQGTMTGGNLLSGGGPAPAGTAVATGLTSPLAADPDSLVGALAAEPTGGFGTLSGTGGMQAQSNASPSGHLNDGIVSSDGSIVLNLGGTTSFNGVALYEVFVGTATATPASYQAGTAYATGLDLLGFDPGLSSPNWVLPFGTRQNRVTGFPDESFAEVQSSDIISTRDFDTGVNLTRPVPEGATLWLAFQYVGQQVELRAIAVPVPEPGAFALVAVGVAAGAMSMRWRPTRGGR